MTLATNLKAVYRACDPDKALAASDDRYVNLSNVRGTTMIAKTIFRSIDRSATGEYHQQLLTGHRGCGKSTELLRLKAELQAEQFFVLYLDVEELLDLGDVSYLDVLLCIAKETESGVRQAGIQLDKHLLADLKQWFTDRIVEKSETDDYVGSVQTQAEAGIEIPFFAKLMSRMTAEIKAGSSRRISTRQKLEKELAVFTAKLNILIAHARSEVQQHGYKDLVLIVDGLEKMHYRLLEDKHSSHAHLFVLNARHLKAPQCHIVYTKPISLAYNNNLGSDFDSILVLPMIKMSDEGIACLRQVIENRVDLAQTFEQPADIDELIKLSGGVMRDLMRLVRFATDTDKAKIGRKDVHDACNTLIREYDRLLRDSELEQLILVNKTRRVTGEEVYARMLNLRVILEYQNGGRWAALHPAVLAVPWLQRAFAESEAAATL